MTKDSICSFAFLCKTTAVGRVQGAVKELCSNDQPLFRYEQKCKIVWQKTVSVFRVFLEMQFFELLSFVIRQQYEYHTLSIFFHKYIYIFFDRFLNLFYYLVSPALFNFDTAHSLLSHSMKSCENNNLMKMYVTNSYISVKIRKWWKCTYKLL